MTAATPDTVRPVRRHGGLRAAARVRVLARIEGRRLLARPTVLAGAGLSLLTMVTLTRTTAPVLNRDDTTASAALLVLAAATLLATNAAALRSRRRATDELLASMPTPPRVRTLASLCSVAGVVALAGLLGGAFLLWRLAADPVTAPDPFELLTGPALVALGGCLGVALARWAPSVTVAPVVVVGLAALEFSVNLLIGGSEYGGRVKWLAPFVGQHGVARELLIRPTGWHLAYLVALVAVLGCVALLRHPATRPTIATAGSAVLVLLLAGGAQLRPLDPAQDPNALAAELTAAAAQDCEQRDDVTYCALPGYEPWVDRWAATVEPVLARLPERARPRPLTVRQDFLGTRLESLADHGGPGTAAEPTHSEVRPGLWRGRNAGEGAYQFGLALGVAALAVGLSPDGALSPADALPGQVGEGLQACTPAGQARSVVALWLAGQTSERSAEYLRNEVERQGGTTAPATGTPAPEIYFARPAAHPIGALNFGGWEAAVAVQLLRQAPDHIAGLVDRHWDTLSDPATTTDEALALLGADYPAPGRPPADVRGPGSTEAGSSGTDWRLVACP